MQPNTETTPATAQAPAVPGTGTGAQATTRLEPVSEEPMATVVVVIMRNRIQVTSTLAMGGRRSVTRVYNRVGAASWKTSDPEFIESEERIGIEMAEFADGLDLPTRVADMLPRLPGDRRDA